MPEVTVVARQPLMLGARPTAGSPVVTHLHVPGSVLRGALAAAWIAEHGTPQSLEGELRQRFLDLFEGKVTYGPLFAEGSAVIPMSVLRCKYQPLGSCRQEMYDEAFPEGGAARVCGQCEGPTEPGKGGVEYFGPPGRLTTETTRIAIDNATGTADEGQLFTRQGLWHREADGEPRRFIGRIGIPQDLSGPARAWLSTARPLRLGGRRSTGGGVEYALSGEAAAGKTMPRTGTPGALLALRLLSPAILVDDSGLPLDPADHVALLRMLTEEVAPVLGVDIRRVVQVWARRERVGGWHAASNLPKPDDQAVSAGSVLLLEPASTPELDGLRRLEETGLGLRRAEGFGVLEAGTRAWQAPAQRPVPPAAAEEDLAESYALRLYKTGLGRWLFDNLREYTVERAAGHSRTRGC